MVAREDSPIEVRIGDKDGDHVSIQVLGRMHPRADDPWDGNWLISPLEVVAGGFRAEVGAGLRSDELSRFRKALESLNETLRGVAVLESAEGWIRLQVAISQQGHLQVTGTVSDRPGSANALTFRVGGMDQSDLSAIIAALVDAEAVFSVIGET